MESITKPQGFRCAGIRAGIKRAGLDLALIVSDVPASCAGVFTQNMVRASSVDFTRAAAVRGRLSAIVANSGCANCCTGGQGEKDTTAMAEATASALGLSVDDVGVASTGVIGVPLKMDRVLEGIGIAARELGKNDDQAAEAIMTTDLAPKQAVEQVEIAGQTVTVGGIAKGSGMIAPNMATMLAFLTTDAEVDPDTLQGLFLRAVDHSFNCVTVDGDTSTNDMALLLANGRSGVRISEGSAGFEPFYAAVETVCIRLAKQIARDGEGATRLIEISVSGAASESEARMAAKAIAESPLVKTAVHGGDPNWGRIVAAAGRSGARFDPSRATLDVQGVRLFERGEPTQFDEPAVAASLKKTEVGVRLDLGAGSGRATFWTCDLTENYIRINAQYRT